jgi:hypothetical protein
LRFVFVLSGLRQQFLRPLCVRLGLYEQLIGFLPCVMGVLRQNAIAGPGG